MVELKTLFDLQGKKTYHNFIVNYGLVWLRQWYILYMIVWVNVKSEEFKK